jgi:uncharacterized protein with NRDE domain
MCLIAVAFAASPRYRLLVAANRDESHQRPTRAAHWWEEQAVFGGRDLVAGGSWLAVNASGHLAAVTNFREAPPAAPRRSRGLLVSDYLAGSEPIELFVERVAEEGAGYAAFNLVLCDGNALHYASNRAGSRRLGPGVYALSNARFGTDWPKVRWAESAMREFLESGRPIEVLLDLLAERHVEQALSAAHPSRFAATPFIVGEDYGTRSTTVVSLENSGEAAFLERRFDSDGRPTGETRQRFLVSSMPAAGAGQVPSKHPGASG